MKAGTGAHLEPPAKPLEAASWVKWGNTSIGTGAASLATARAGDIVVVVPGDDADARHVGFVMAADATAGRIWVLGGNQAKGTCVCLSQFKGTQVVEIRRAANPATDDGGSRCWTPRHSAARPRQLSRSADGRMSHFRYCNAY